MQFVACTLSVTAPLSTSVPTFGSAPVYELVREDLRQDVHVLRSSTLESHRGLFPASLHTVFGSGVVCISVCAVRPSCNGLEWNTVTSTRFRSLSARKPSQRQSRSRQISYKASTPWMSNRRRSDPSGKRKCTLRRAREVS